MFVQKEFQVEIESTKQLPRAKTNTPIDYSILNMKFLKLEIWNSKNYKYEIPRITNLKF